MICLGVGSEPSMSSCKLLGVNSVESPSELRHTQVVTLALPGRTVTKTCICWNKTSMEDRKFEEKKFSFYTACSIRYQTISTGNNNQHLRDAVQLCVFSDLKVELKFAVNMHKPRGQIQPSCTMSKQWYDKQKASSSTFFHALGSTKTMATLL